jgi:uncharacterized protein
MKRTALLAVAALIISSCGDNGGPDDGNFDRRRMLSDMADNVIVRTYERLDEASVVLVTQTEQFIGMPTSASLDSVRAAWLRMAEAWQPAQLFEFGPAEGILGDLAENINTFPASVTKIEAAIAASDTLLQNFDRDARGLPAIEYLLFASSADSTVAAFNASAVRKAYLRAIARDVRSNVTRVYTAWAGTYRDDFVARNGTDAGSGTSEVFNAMNRGFELLKNYKIGLPAGLQAGQTAPEPMKVEAPYAKVSWRLATLHMKAVRDVWFGGMVNGTRSLSFRDYVLAMGGEELERSTMRQLDSIDMIGATIFVDEDLGAMCAANDARVAMYYAQLQKLTRFIKSETSSLLGISITYSSGDGD